MSSQLGLFDSLVRRTIGDEFEALGRDLGVPPPDPRALARRTDPETSKAAAQSASSMAGRHEELILSALRRMPQGGTKDDLARATGLDGVAVARRMRKMADEGRVRESGKTRKTPSGRAAIVWAAGSGG